MAGEIKQFPLDEEYKKKTGISKQDIAKFRAWLKTQPHLPEKEITDLDLILIFHCCDRSTSVSKEVLDLHYTLKTLFPFLKRREVDAKLEKALNTYLFTPLPTRSRNGAATIYCRFLDTDPKNFVQPEAFRAILMVIDLWQYEEGTWPGFTLLVDLEGFTMGHLGKLELINLQQFFYFLQEAMLVKLRGFHFINPPSFIDKFMMIIRPFLKKALLDVLNIHQVGSTTLDKHYPIEALPIEAGGKYQSLEDCKNQVIEKVKANKHFFDEENKKIVQESLRPGKPKTITDIFGGIEGSFKKLDID